MIERAQTAQIKDRLRQATEQAKALRIFGSPSFVVPGELFWGDDRLEMALQRAADPAP